MKHSRNEIVKSIVSSYMKKRRYSDTESKYEQPMKRTAERSAVRTLVDLEASYSNSIMYKCVHNDPAVIEGQFAALKLWISEIKVPKTSEELKAILFPMLCHLYIEMLNGGHKTDASAFLLKYQSISSEEGLELLEELASVDTAKDISEKKVLSSLRSSKYQVTLSAESIQILKQYLTKKAHVIILQIINCWFDLEEARLAAEPLLDLCEDNSPTVGSVSDELLIGGDNDLVKVDEIIRQVNDGPTFPAPLLVYAISNSERNLTCARLSADTPVLASGFSTSQIRLWSLTHKPLVGPDSKPVPGTSIRLATAASSSKESAEKKSRQFDFSTDYDRCVELLGHSGVVQDLAFVPSSDLLVSVSMDKTMRAWNLKSYTCVSLYRGHTWPIWCVEASPLTGHIATGSHDQTARLWSLELNFPLRIFAGHVQDVDCLRFHPNGNYLATGSSDNSLRLWSVHSGELIRVLEGHRSGIMAIAFSPNGYQIASAGDDKRIKVWDIRNSKIVGEFRGYADTIVSLDWSPNSDYIASCCMDNTVKLCPVRNIVTDEEPLPTKLHRVDCNSIFNVKYSRQNTPVCVVGKPYVFVRKPKAQ